MSDVKSVCFGISAGPLDQGATPSCAINAGNTVVEVHKSEANSGLWWWIGKVQGASLLWEGHDSVNGDTGYNPSVALTDSNVVVEVHDSGHGTLWYWTGQVSGNRIAWKNHAQYDTGITPAVAVSQHGVVVEVHRSEVLFGDLYWWVFQLDGTSLRKGGHSSIRGDSGYNPSVALNNNGLVVEVHASGHGTLWYWIGQVNGSSIDWYGHAQYDSGDRPSVSLTDDNMVFEVHDSGHGTLWQRIGRVVGDRIEWVDWFGNGAMSYYYDDGVMPQIACNGRAAVQVHVSENFPELYADASLVFNRARWMGDHLEAILGGKKLNQLALPASHDAAMYPGGFSFSILGKTQDLNIYGQLAYGVRYFDLRPKYKNDDFILHHDIIDGPQLSDVLDQIRQFFEEGHRELAVLKFSHYDGFDQDVFSKFCLRILDKTSGLGNWLYYANRPLETRLADRTLSTYLAKQGTALVVCDGSYLFPPSPSPSPPSTSPGGLFYYRDWESSDPGNGDLTVFDIYSNTTSFDTMANSKDPSEYGLPRGQLPKFRGNPPSYQGFNGKCLNDASIPCDLFLLSWTLTPITAVWPFSRLANKELVDNMAATGSNGFGQTVNLLYTDYSEYSRSTDVAVIRNGCAPT